MTNYDAFAETFSDSRKNMHWPEVDTIVADIESQGYESLLDIGCGNGRLLDYWSRNPSQYLGIDSSQGMIVEAQKLHPGYRFEVGDMLLLSSGVEHPHYDAIVLLASFHHIAGIGERKKVLQNLRTYLALGGALYMTNWNLREQDRYKQSRQGNGDYAIKIGAHSRYYHGFTLDELAHLAEGTGWTIVENRIFDGGRNLYTKLISMPMFSSLIIPSPLGDLIAVASDTHLVLLEFADSPQLSKKLEKFGFVIPRNEESAQGKRTQTPHTSAGQKKNQILTQTELELAEYFEGKRKVFTLPYRFAVGTDFQKQAWDALTKIPYGETRNYKEEAILAGNPRAVRAIGGANNKNPIVIVIPCHRVIGADGKLVGYGGGIERKQWLLKHEQHYS